MAPPRGRKRKSDQSTVSTADDHAAHNTARIPTKGTPTADDDMESPRKRRKVGLTLGQKQALIDNLQLEITERARKLRAQYNLQAQGLRTRIEIRVNRIPMALRKAKMGDLMKKYTTEQQQQQQQPKSTVPTAPAFTAPPVARPPPVPEKDAHLTRPVSQRSVPQTATSRPATGRAAEHLRHERHETPDMNKENEADYTEGKKRSRAHRGAEGPPNPAQVLSPTSTNTRALPRERTAASPGKSFIARPASPTKQPSSSNLISNMVEKARSTRAAATTRKTTASSSASSAAGGTTTTGRTRRGAAVAAAAAPTKATATKTARRVSAISESSDGSTSTVVRKPTGRAAAATKTAAPAPATKRTVMGTIRKGVTGAATKKAAATKTAAPASTATGRVLRKRN